jgi:FkbM family methyltransferase
MPTLLTSFFKLSRAMSVRSWRRALFKYYVAASTEHVSVISSLGRLCTVVDIGANKGQFALLISSLFPDAILFSFEPLPRPASIFKKVFRANSNIRLLEVAIGPESGEALIHVSARDDSSSLLPISALQSSVFPGTKEASRFYIKVETLDTFLAKSDLFPPSLLKVDVQGFEYEALQGSESLLDCFDYVYCECSFIELYVGQKLAYEVVDWLRSRGFVLLGIYNTFYDDKGVAVQADFLFKKHL